MSALGRLASLGWRDRLLLVRALWRLAQATVAVRLLAYSRLRAQILTQPACSAAPSPYATAQRVAWAIECVARRLPGMTCLIKALAGRSLLAKYGYPATLRIGVTKDVTKDATKDAERQFGAHAWLEQHGCVLLGGSTAPLEYAMLDLKGVRGHMCRRDLM